MPVHLQTGSAKERKDKEKLVNNTKRPSDSKIYLLVFKQGETTIPCT